MRHGARTSIPSPQARKRERADRRDPSRGDASAASASMRVNPAVPRSLGLAEGNNFHASGEPIHPNLKAAALARDSDRPPARRAAGKEIDRRPRRSSSRSVRPGSRQTRHQPANARPCLLRPTRRYASPRSEKWRPWRAGGSRRSDPPSAEWRLHSISREPRLRRPYRHCRQRDHREKRDDREDAYDLDQSETALVCPWSQLPRGTRDQLAADAPPSGPKMPKEAIS